MRPADRLGASDFRLGRLDPVWRLRPGLKMPIMTVPLHRLASCLPDRVLQSRNRLLLRSGSAGHVENLLLQNRAVKIVHAIAERYLGQGKTHADPIGGKVIDIIEVNAAYGEIAKLFDGRGRLDVREDGGLWFESKWNKSGETACLIL